MICGYRSRPRALPGMFDRPAGLPRVRRVGTHRQHEGRLVMTARRRGGPAEAAPRVIVAGAGFAGLAAVTELHRAGARVLLIDRNIYSTFQPLLYQVATGGLNPGDVAFPLGTFAYNNAARFRPGLLAGIDPAARRITLTDGTALDYDYLVLGTG